MDIYLGKSVNHDLNSSLLEPFKHMGAEDRIDKLPLLSVKCFTHKKTNFFDREPFCQSLRLTILSAHTHHVYKKQGVILLITILSSIMEFFGHFYSKIMNSDPAAYSSQQKFLNDNNSMLFKVLKVSQIFMLKTSKNTYNPGKNTEKVSGKSALFIRSTKPSVVPAIL